MKVVGKHGKELEDFKEYWNQSPDLWYWKHFIINEKDLKELNLCIRKNNDTVMKLTNSSGLRGH